MYQFNRKEYEERMKWYQDARFGMFIHWGLYSIPARGEWVRCQKIFGFCWPSILPLLSFTFICSGLIC